MHANAPTPPSGLSLSKPCLLHYRSEKKREPFDMLRVNGASFGQGIFQ
jgi:hypothetical protein